MLVFAKEQLVVLAVPKTGTSALSAALAPRASMVLRNPPSIKHVNMRRYQRFLRPLINQSQGNNPEVMAIIRHPIDWLGSWYRYRTRDALLGHENSTANISFDDFVLEYCKGKPAEFAKIGSQNKFVRLNDDNLGVDHLFRYEALNKAVQFLERRLDVEINLPIRNVSPVLDLQLSPDIKQRLHEKRGEEFAIWEQAQS
ncbi:sulfotransferase family 2 domain-containing protein [Yoonia maritima]|uniref:sulfotransferase family 2 domain-containing protein n=1 Tax=Yoonia maritima TaxID=1435347 RepID=UPI000D0FFAB6|nr:sulfotransferase family 2 domain-containing protein [Yoonia maritima]